MTHVYVTVKRQAHYDLEGHMMGYSSTYWTQAVQRICATEEEAFKLAREGEKIYEVKLGEAFRDDLCYGRLPELPAPTLRQHAARRAAQTRKENAGRKAKSKIKALKGHKKLCPYFLKITLGSVRLEA